MLKNTKQILYYVLGQWKESRIFSLYFLCISFFCSHECKKGENLARFSFRKWFATLYLTICRGSYERNSPSFNFWSLLRWLALAIAPALAIQFPVVQSLTHNRSLVIVLLAFYEVALSSSTLSQDLQQVEEPWIKEWLMPWSSSQPPLGYYRHYRRYFFEEHRTLM